VGEILLLEPELLQPLPDQKRNIHGIPLLGAEPLLGKIKLTSSCKDDKIRHVLDKYSTARYVAIQ
jgi:hypothetical protein